MRSEEEIRLYQRRLGAAIETCKSYDQLDRAERIATVLVGIEYCLGDIEGCQFEPEEAAKLDKIANAMERGEQFGMN